MGDFLLDMRQRGERCDNGEMLRFYSDMKVDRIDRSDFTLFVTRTGSDRLWAPYESPDGVVVAVAGRVAIDESSWRTAASVDGAGGLACKAIYKKFRDDGIESLGTIGGGYAIHVFDRLNNQYHLVSDCAGALPCYGTTTSDALICSHPDALARLAGSRTGGSVDGQDGWDLTSMAQFLSTGVVSYPYSYYRHVFALDFAAVHSYNLGDSGPRRTVSTRNSPCWDQCPADNSEEAIANRLANAIVKASRHRTLPLLGPTAVALSGGLDSRAILCAARRHEHLFAFCAFDQKNKEFGYAKSIAENLDVPLIPFERKFDHYADNAEMGVLISGGMGDIASNHFLGFRDRLNELGVENIVSGCYFDYFFKSLALDAREQGLLRRERFCKFSFETYLPHFCISPTFMSGVADRMNVVFPEADRMAFDPSTHIRNAMRRTFPGYQEGDNAQRLIPQRVMNWYPAAVDPGLVELSRQIPPHLKLNKQLFRLAVRQISGESVSKIPDANTGLPVSASGWRVGLNRYRIAMRRRYERRRMSIASNESWPNWPYYVRTSMKLHGLWKRPNPVARQLISELTGEPFQEDVACYGHRPTQYFMRLLTLKLWLDQRDQFPLRSSQLG